MTVISPPSHLDAADATAGGVGDLLWTWRARRCLSQLDRACEAEVSSRQLGFVETERAQANCEMLLRLAERLDMACASATASCWLAATRRSTPSARWTARTCQQHGSQWMR
jgi:transcriptional regulator with XRE-family HTH domain